MFPCLRFRSLVSSLVVTLALLFSFAPLGDATVVTSDEARWKDGELMAPLPLDPARRAAALETARAVASSRQSESPTVKSVRYTSSGDAPMVYPVRVSRPTGNRHLPAADPRSAEWLSDLQARLRPPVDAETPSDAPSHSAAVTPAQAIELNGAQASPPSTTFDGIDFTGWNPAYPGVAAGPNHLLLATADRFSVMDKCGNTLDTDLFRTRFGLPGTQTYYNAKVIFDPWTPRWIMMYTGLENALTNSVLYIAVSETPDPLGDWYYYSVPTSVFLPGLKDDISIAVTPDEIYFAWNQFNLGTFAFEQSVIIEMVKADVYDAVAVSIFKHAGMTNPNDATAAFSIRPAQMRTYGGEMYFVNNDFAGDDFFTLWELTGNPGSSILTGFDMTVTAYAMPPDMPQPNATLVDAGDCRVRSAVYSSGSLYAAYTRDEGLGNGSAVEVRQFDVATAASLGGAYLPGGAALDSAYPAIDIDENDQVTWAFCQVGAAKFLSISYFVLTVVPISVVDQGEFFNGQANFAFGSQPYRWGPYFDVALDPSDGRTAWVQGLYASNSPVNSWTTRVGAVSSFTASNLVVDVQTTPWVAGFEGGPFAPTQIDIELSNTGGTNANWELTSVPSWLTPSAVSGSLDVGATQDVTLFVNATADGMPSGIYNDSVLFSNCTGTGGASPPATLAIGLDGSCPGAQVTLVPDVAPAGGAISPASTELGAFVTAIRDVSMCAIGIEASVDAPVNATVHVYAADGITRGALLASSAPYTIVFGTTQTHVIPIDFDLTACSEYDIAVEFADVVTWPYWNDPSTTAGGFDAGGMIRVRNAETDGNAADMRTPRLKVFMDVITGPNSTDLAAAAGYGFEISANQARGNFVIPERTMRVHSLGLEADLVPGTTLTARVYKAAAAVRTGLLAEGTTIVVSPAFTFHDVPISAVLLAGAQYDIEIEWEQSAVWGSYSIPPATVPYTVANTMTIYGAEVGGVITIDIPHMRLSWSDETPAYHFLLAKPGQPLPSPLTSTGTLSHGAYITSLIDQEVYGLGVMADVPDGAFITAYLYRAVGTTRGPLIASAAVISDGAGMQWHDIPISATLFANNEYDLAFTSAGVSEWPYWLDTPGLPYDVYGTFRVRDAEAGGVIGTAFLAHMRVHACNATLTPVTDDPRRAPMMLLAPAPNPTNAMVRFNYSVDEAGEVEIAIYDVAGRRVAQVARKRAEQAGVDAVDFDTSKLASGVYFVKLSTSTKSASRKFVVTH